MNDPLISRYLSPLEGHIVKRYRWVEYRAKDRGDHTITVDDLKQIAAIELIKLTARWDDELTQRGETREDDNGGLFWTFLVNRVKGAIFNYAHDHDHEHQKSLDDELEHALAGEERTHLRAPVEPVSWYATHQTLVDYFATLSTKDKTFIALRYYDNLTLRQIADVVGTGSASYTLREVVSRWRDFARNQVTDHSVNIPSRIGKRWTPPDSLHEYVRTRHRKELSDYLGIVTLSLRADPGYLPEILSDNDRWFPPGAYESRALSPFMQAQIDAMHRDGKKPTAISRDLGLDLQLVKYHLRHRRAA